MPCSEDKGFSWLLSLDREWYICRACPCPGWPIVFRPQLVLKLAAAVGKAGVWVVF
jgi:hypothetical protein